MSLLSYLVPRIASKGPEPAATQALAYILSASPDLATAFVDVVGRTGIAAFMPGRIAAEVRQGNAFPDLTISDTGGVLRILVENKFWAPLTDAQPLAYLEELPSDASSALVFVVPHQRMYGLWGELRERCHRGGVELEDESRSETIHCARAGQRTLAITSWKYVLETLERAASAGGHTTLQQDIVQLRGLTDHMNNAAFLPLREDEISDMNVARRLKNYTGLIDEIVKRLVAEGVGDTDGLGTSRGLEVQGRYLRMHARFEAWLGVDLYAWGKWGITPIWAEHNTRSSSSGIEGQIRQAELLFDNVQEDDGWLYLPIRLTTGVERERVVDDAVLQMRSIAEKLRTEFPDE